MSSNEEHAHGGPEITVPREHLSAELKTRIAKGNGLLSPRAWNWESLETFERQFDTWTEYNQELLRKRFTTSNVVDEYTHSGGMRVTGSRRPLSDQVRTAQNYLREKIRFLTSLHERLELYEEQASQPVTGTVRANPTNAGGAVFVVHGHDHGLKQDVIRFVEKVTSAQCIVLEEQAKQGRTVIEAFEAQAATAAFAIVLITGDDEGRKAGGETWKRRPRQNVVFELGYFFGALGRSRVAALFERETELPSDVHGILYTQLDERDGWKLELAREMKAADLEVDLNKAV